MRETSVVRRLIVSLLVCEAIMVVSVGLLFLMAGRISVTPVTFRFLKFAVGLGIPVTLLSFGICNSIAAKHRYATCLAISGAVGFIVSVLWGYVWASLADSWAMGWGHYSSPLSSWGRGLLLAVPSAIAGAAIGWLEVRFALRSAVR